MSKIILCGKPHGCCPTVEDIEYGKLIKDDFGGEVKLTKEQFEIMKKVE